MSELSVFIDESGDSGTNSKFYLVTLVFHDQSRPIDNDIAHLGWQLRDIGCPVNEAIHSGPLIRREEIYAHMDVIQRRRIFSRLYAFTKNCGITYTTFAYRKSELGAGNAREIAERLQARLARDIDLFLRGSLAYFTGFDRVIVYYDRGQHVVTAAVRDAFEDVLFDVDFRLVLPHQYRLFQAADLVCTLELLRCKADDAALSRSERAFFGSTTRLRKNYLRQLARLRL